MIYAATITTLANTSKATAKQTVLKLTKGLIWRVDIEFPPGPSGLLHTQIFDGSYQFFPATPGSSFHSDANLIGFDDLYYKTSEPFEFVIKTWNLDETWQHTLQVRIGVASNEAFMSRYLPSLTYDRFADTLAEIKADQEKVKTIQLQDIIDEVII